MAYGTKRGYRFKLERAGSQASSLTRPAGFQPVEYSLQLVDKLEASLPNQPRWLTSYEKNRNSFWTGTQFSAGVCRAGESENRRQRYRRRVCQDRQGDSRRAVRIRRGDRSHLARRAILSRLAQECCANRHCGSQQSVLVELCRQVFQQRAGDENRRGRSAHGVASIT